jgi:hypothetical protein
MGWPDSAGTAELAARPVNVRRRYRVHVYRGPEHRFTLQELADFVELCARRNMPPSTPIVVRVDGRERATFELEAVTGDE